MKAYMGYDGVAGQSECAVLIFAGTSKEARKLGFDTMRSFLDTEWIDMRARLMKDLPVHLKKLDIDKPQVIDSPPSCPNCELWGEVMADDWQSCEGCWDDEE